MECVDASLILLNVLYTQQCDAHHEITDLKVFVVVIPKDGWARVAAPILHLV